tara:strand:- start:57509 stop:57796 length:288 start_codon:yes stop_codon:yes gene_type:complete
MIATTSREAYADHISSGALGYQQALVLQTIEAMAPVTRHDIATLTDLPLQSVCGRVNELIEMGHVVSTETDRSSGYPRHLLEIGTGAPEPQGVLL